MHGYPSLLLQSEQSSHGVSVPMVASNRRTYDLTACVYVTDVHTVIDGTRSTHQQLIAASLRWAGGHARATPAPSSHLRSLTKAAQLVLAGGLEGTMSHGAIEEGANTTSALTQRFRRRQVPFSSMSVAVTRNLTANRSQFGVGSRRQMDRQCVLQSVCCAETAACSEWSPQWHSGSVMSLLAASLEFESLRAQCFFLSYGRGPKRQRSAGNTLRMQGTMF